ncbi:hypothetical protein G6F40_017453 [Rhizopus arrhizus]|nr:hypothetical protein G6F40_017453 [Rhizopus arrhizus]
MPDVETIAGPHDLHRGHRTVAVLQRDVPAGLLVPALLLRQMERAVHPPRRPVQPHPQRLWILGPGRRAQRDRGQAPHGVAPTSCETRMHDLPRYPTTLCGRCCGGLTSSAISRRGRTTA